MRRFLAISWLALGLQALVLTGMVLVTHYGISLRGEMLEVGLIIATVIVSVWAVSQLAILRQPRVPKWFKALYWINCLGIVPLAFATLMLGLGLYSVKPLGVFESPSGTQIALKEHIGLLGCSVYPYRIQGAIEQHIANRDNAVPCFTVSGLFTIKDVRWNPDETQLILTVAIQRSVNSDPSTEDYTFELTTGTD
ncbi:MAG: hypothetical protein AAGE59_34675 [Cyanobacteria bacterium P01_F01_bin.86]